MQQDGGNAATAVVGLGPERQRLMSRQPGQSRRTAPKLAKAPQELLPPDSGRLPGRERTKARARAVGVVAVVMDLAAVAAGYQLAGQVGPPLLWFSVAVWPLTFALYGLYSPRRVLSASEEARRLFHGVAV